MLATEVVAAVVSRDEVVEDLYRLHRAGLCRLAQLLVDDPGSADEVVQDVFASLLAARRTPAPGSELAYLRRAVVNRSRSELRKRRVRRAAVLPAERPPDNADDGRRALVRAAVRTLPQRQRECVALRYYADLGDADIAAALGISAGSVKQHLSRARDALATALQEER